MLQAVLQLLLPLRGELAELRIVFESAPLLRGRQIFIVAQPGSGMTGLIVRRLIPRRLILRKLVLRSVVALQLPAGTAGVHLRTSWLRASWLGSGSGLVSAARLRWPLARLGKGRREQR
jgi:hypothetical protein